MGEPGAGWRPRGRAAGRHGLVGTEDTWAWMGMVRLGLGLLQGSPH